MKEASEKAVAGNLRKLADAVRDVKNDTADRSDVVVELREAQHMRLELLAAELQPVFDDVPASIDVFDFAISSGLQPRLWIDAVSHVTMGRDRRTYRFLKDTRLGRVVLAESTDIEPVADKVTRYVAERMVEREQLMEGGVEPVAGRKGEPAAELKSPGDKPETRARAVVTGVGLVLAGALVGLAVAGAVFWERLAAQGISF
jgi:hypothetical protein